MRRSTRLLVVPLAIIACLALISACTVVKIGEEQSSDESQYSTWLKTGTGFQADEFVAAVWDEEVIPIFESEAVDCATVLDALRADRTAACEQYGLRRETGEPFYAFKVRGTAAVVEFDDSSRNGVILVDLLPDLGQVDTRLQVGPVIRGTAIRDALEFIRFTDIGNQLQFAALANEFNARMRQDSVEPLNLEEIAGERISFLGAFRLEAEQSVDDIVITPVRIDLIEGSDG
jgi:predicted lipoprotein